MPAGARYTSATVNSGGGGFVQVGTAYTDVTVTATIALTIGDRVRLTSGGDLDLTAFARGLAVADSTNGGGGFIAIGRSDADADVTVTTTIDIGTGVVVTSGWELHIDAETTGDVQAKSDARAGGLGAGVNARARGDIILNTVIDIDGSLIAEHKLGIRGLTSPNGNVTAYARARGLGADSTANDYDNNYGLFVTAKTTIDIAGNNVIQGDEIDIRALMGQGSLRAHSESDAKAFAADSDARSNIVVRGGAELTIRSGILLQGWESIALRAEVSGLNGTSRAHASCGCAGGDTDAIARIDYSTDATVTAHAGVLVRTHDLDVDTVQSVSMNRNATNRKVGLDVGSTSQPGGTTGNRPIHWDADVVLHGGNPQLYIGEDGRILKLYGMQVWVDGALRGVGYQIAAGALVEVRPIVNTGERPPTSRSTRTASAATAI
ncbi:hypothetical protein [Microbacterium sp. NIBRBAC000506063]|uniref:hypothetical protein n=1 Tax=Microbacterium sp. NIBRBAC000506063 TaxID=2734618 RepID=UPI001BB72832|nr:hypothetical protein [Microbacterium sp. NIBRBAC000506063]QTV78946.1 hypothetical protein KAE78_07010 [Microbacterium sp. NIBRBAC000506063]